MFLRAERRPGDGAPDVGAPGVSAPGVGGWRMDMPAHRALLHPCRFKKATLISVRNQADTELSWNCYTELLFRSPTPAGRLTEFRTGSCLQ